MQLHLSVEQITSGTHHHFFGYIGQSQTIPWNASGSTILALRTGFHDHMPRPHEPADIVLIDTGEGRRVSVVDRTFAWNFQQGTMLYWNPELPETQFFFNDRDPETNKVFAVLFDISKGVRVREYRYEDTPFGNSGVAQGGGAFLGINYGRMARLREVTGYPAAYDWTGSAKAPENDGIFIVNVHTGEKRLLVSFRALADAVRPVRPNVDQAALYTNHTLWNRNDDRIYFFLRGRYRSQPMWINVPCTIRPDGSELVAHELYIGGHPEWADGNRVIGALDGRQILYDVDAKQVVGQIGTTEILPMPKSDCSLSPGGDWFVSGYTSGRENQYVFLRQSDGARVRSGAFSRGPYTRGSLRIDPAPRWNRTNDAVLVSTWTREEQTRQLFTVRIHEGTSEQTETLLENRPDRSRKIIVAGIMGQPIRKGNYKERNYQETESLIREAAQAGAQLVCTFEQFLDGYGFDANKIESMEDERIARYEVLGESECVGRLGDLARELDIVIVAGVGIREASRTYNSALIFDRSGRLTGIYRKTHNRNRYATWFAPLSNAEKKARCPSFDIGSGRIGVKICNDRHFRETTAYMIEDGCELLLCPSYGRYDPSRLKEDTAEFGVWAVFVHPRGCQFIDRGKIVYEQPAVNGKGSIAVHEVEFRTPDTTGLEMQNPTTQLPNGGSDP